MSTKGGPVFAFSLPGGRLAPLASVSYGTVHSNQVSASGVHTTEDSVSFTFILVSLNILKA